MATTDTVRAMTRVQRRTHEALAIEIGHQPTLDMLNADDSQIERDLAEMGVGNAIREAARLFGKQEAARLAYIALRGLS